jgi:thiamine kinase-like enzyme
VDSGKSTPELIYALLAGKAGTRLSNIVRDKLQTYIVRNRDIFDRIDCNFVLCHGDMSNSNTLLSDGKVYFIDFEYALAESRFRDIGKFFRSKAPAVQRYINEEVYKAFADGYGRLPSDWLRLAKLADIPVMLGLLNIDNAPQEWVTDIEHDILEVMG